MADYYEYNLKAGQPTTALVQGQLILVDNITGADGVDITPVLNSSTGRTMPGRTRAFKCWTPFDTIILQAATDCRVGIWLSKTDVSLGFADGSTVNVQGNVKVTNDAANRIPVNVDGGTINVTASVQSFATFTHPAPANVGVAAASVINDNTLKRLRFRNISATQTIALGGPGVTLSSPILLQPGDMWTEDDAAGANWYAIASAAGAQLAIMGMKP